MSYKVFVDGSSGTTGLRIVQRLRERKEIELLAIAERARKDEAARLERFFEADAVILCLPDEEAKAIVLAADAAASGRCRIIDCSTAHRTQAGWAYGMPELREPPARGALAAGKPAPGGGSAGGARLSQIIRDSARVANPGCHATGFILMARPLVEAGLISADAFLAVTSITGYSGGGKSMIAEYEGIQSAAQDTNQPLLSAPRLYGLSQEHKHLPEMLKYSLLSRTPAFSPIVSDYYAGMLVSVPLPEDCDVGAADVLAVLKDYYADCPLIHVRDAGSDPEKGFLSAVAFSGRDDAELYVFGREAVADEPARLTVCCRFDNLGKGASGAAIQNLNIMLGLPETNGLVTGN